MDSVTHVVYNDGELAIEGVSVTFTCPPGLVLTGPNTTTCMRNGDWEPDPRDAACVGTTATKC